MPDTNYPKEFLRLLKLRLPEMLSTLQRLVLAESPSLEKEPADLCCDLLAAEWHKRGASVEHILQKHRGDQLRIIWWPRKSRPAGQFLVLGHYDTVYSSGALAKMPFRVSDGKAYGPGIFDMKAGLTQALFAVFVLEPSLGPRGLIKTARKGVGEAELIVHGHASHAGLAPQEGINAVHELAQQLTRIQEWNDLRRGVTVNADIIEGGTRVNVIAERARAVLDLRALRLADMRRIERRLHALRPILPGAKLEVRGGFNRAPLERKFSAALFAKAKSQAAQMGLSLGECTAGGGSDGNLTAALGVPTLDGLGAVGHGAHSANEYILINTMPARAALLAALLLNS